MLQTVDGISMYIVDFDTMPTLPITWHTEEEKPYAQSLTGAIQDGLITKPGKYGIQIDPENDNNYIVYAIIE